VQPEQVNLGNLRDNPGARKKRRRVGRSSFHLHRTTPMNPLPCYNMELRKRGRSLGRFWGFNMGRDFLNGSARGGAFLQGVRWRVPEQGITGWMHTAAERGRAVRGAGVSEAGGERHRRVGTRGSTRGQVSAQGSRCKG
jgi:hypothetical protein